MGDAIAAAFEAKTGHKAVMSFGPSGAFYAQIRQGAPFEIFLSADAERPARLEAEGFGVKGTRFVYAYGALVLWSTQPDLVDGKGQVLKTGRFHHIAILLLHDLRGAWPSSSHDRSSAPLYLFRQPKAPSSPASGMRRMRGPPKLASPLALNGSRDDAFDDVALAE